MATFATEIVKPDAHLRFYVLIQGIPYVFLDGLTPVGPTGAAWAAPSQGGRSYTLQAHGLDVSGGIKDVGPEISRRTGEVSPSRMSIVLQEDRAATLLGIMAREKSGGVTADVTASFGYATGGGPTVMTVQSTAAFAAAGLLYFGRETIYHSGKTGTTFTGLTRSLFELEATAGGTRYGDTKYVSNADLPIGQGFSTVSEYPSVWHGRWVSLRAFVVDAEGRALGTAFGGTDSREIWRGSIRGNPRPMDDWHRWQIDCTSLEALLQTDVGPREIKGQLAKIPGGWKANQAGKVATDADGKPIFDAESSGGTMLVTADVSRFVVEIVEYSSEANYPGTAAAKYSLDFAAASLGVHHRSSLRASLNALTEAALVAAGISNLILHWSWWSSSGRWVLQPDSQASYVYALRISWEAEGSIGPLLGFSGVSTTKATGATGAVSAATQAWSIYIGAAATEIPLWFTEVEGLTPSTAGLPDGLATAGFAKIGGKEIVEYTGLSAISTTKAKGLYKLTGCSRGSMGTTAAIHAVTLAADYTSDAEDVSIEFGVGFDGVDPLTAILQLAVSTGETAHHTAYDALGYGVSPPLNPLHFDTDQIAALSAALTGQQKALRLFVSKPHRLSELAGKWLAPFGMHLVARVTSAGAYRIQVGEVLPPLESEASTAIGTAQIDRSDPARWDDGTDRIVNQIVVKYRWDVLTEAVTDDKVTVNAFDSQREYGVRGRLTWELVGYQLDALSGQATAHGWAMEAVSRFARPYDRFVVRVGRTGWLVRPGDSVSLTLPGVPTTSGARGLTSELAVVLQVTHRYWSGSESTEGTGSDLMVILEPHGRQSTYSPSGKVASKAGSTITLEANAFTSPGWSTDAAHFDAGDVIVVFTRGDVSTRETKTILGIAGNVLTLNSAVTLTVGANTYIVAEDYVAAQSSQRAHVHLASDADPAALSAPGDTEFFSYV